MRFCWRSNLLLHRFLSFYLPFCTYFRHINIEVYALCKRILKRSSSTQNSPTDSYQFIGVYIMSVINRRKLSIIINHLDTVKKKAAGHPVRAWNNLSQRTVWHGTPVCDIVIHDWKASASFTIPVQAFGSLTFFSHYLRGYIICHYCKFPSS